MGRFLLPPEFLSVESKEANPAGWVSFHLPKPQLSLPKGFIHADYAASTPLDVDVFEEMAPWLFTWFGNPSAHTHRMGEIAQRKLGEARERCAACLGILPEEILFTSSATESNNLIIRGLATDPRRRRSAIAYGATEHSSISATVNSLVPKGISARKLDVDPCGQITSEATILAGHSDTLLVCLMDVNNETGILQSGLASVIDAAHAAGALVHIDAAQGFARGSFLARSLDWDSLTISGSKIYGPRGSALLAVKRRQRRIPLAAQLTGGGHEFGLRASTSHVAGAVGLARAMEISDREREARNEHLRALSAHFEGELLKRRPDTLIHGRGAPRAPGIAMLTLPGVNPLKLSEILPQLGFGLGAACKTGQAASSVLLEMGVPHDEAGASLRISFGVPSSLAEAQEAAILLGSQ